MQCNMHVFSMASTCSFAGVIQFALIHCMLATYHDYTAQWTGSEASVTSVGKLLAACMLINAWVG